MHSEWVAWKLHWKMKNGGVWRKIYIKDRMLWSFNESSPKKFSHESIAWGQNRRMAGTLYGMGRWGIHSMSEISDKWRGQFANLQPARWNLAPAALPEICNSLTDWLDLRMSQRCSTSVSQRATLTTSVACGQICYIFPCYVSTVCMQC